MQRLYKLSICLLAAGLALSACSDLSMFTPSVDESVGVKILSLSEGQMVEEGESIGFIIQTEGQNTEPVLLEISLIAQSGQSVWSTSISSPLTDEELDLVLPDLLETGQYTIVFTVQGEEGVLEEKKLSFFYVTGQYDILGISSYPPTSIARHETLIQADLLYPEGADPYVRWSQGDSVLAAGRVSEGLQSISWVAPKDEGVYSISLEMFPVPPPTGTKFSFSSSLVFTAQLYVATANILTEDELVPEDLYYSLFHLNGTLKNSGLLGRGTTRTEAQLIGQAKLSSEQGVIGYRTGSGAGLFYPLNVLPILQGALSPCTITFKLQAASENKDRSLMAVTNRNGGFQFRIFFDADGQPVATFRFEDTVLHLPSQIPGLEPGKHHRIDLSLVPVDNGLQALWFLDGLQTASVFDAPLPADLAPGGETLIGGDDGFEGIITEMGVYFKDPLDRPSVDPGIYRETMRRKYGRLLILAEGFEGLYLPDPDSWKLQPKDAEAYLRGGRLILPASSSLTLPYFELGKEDTSFLVEFFGQIPPGSTIALQWEGTDSPFLVVDPTGQLIEAGTDAEEFSPVAGSLRLTLSRSALTLATANTPIHYSFDIPADPNVWLSVTLRSPERQDTLAIDTILIVQESGS
jgi:hypothetical protein